MPYTLTQLPNEPILLLNWAHIPNTTSILSAYQASLGLAAQLEAPRCHITDLHILEYMTEAELMPALDALRQGFEILRQVDGLLFTALIAPSDWHDLLIRYGIQSAAFPNLDEAYAYLRLRLDGQYLRQTLSGHDTFNVYEITNQIILDDFDGEGKETQRGTVHFPPQSLLHLQALHMDKSLLVFPQRGLILGRRTAENDKPDVDFSLWAGYQQGVSRRHAKIHNEGGRLYVTDLDSRNKTFLNGQRLLPFQLYTLHDNDLLRLGRLLLRLHFQSGE